MSIERKYREEIVRYGRMLHTRGFVAAMDGNLSVRLDSERLLVTPTGLSKGSMRPADMVGVLLPAVLRIMDEQVGSRGCRISGRPFGTQRKALHAQRASIHMVITE